MSMFGPRSGSWWFSSQSNPQWNDSGKSDVGGFGMCQEARNALEQKKGYLGDPPTDLEHGYMKD